MVRREGFWRAHILLSLATPYSQPFRHLTVIGRFVVITTIVRHFAY